ncbi:unnamed protein product, partial [Durusdinium trenchii]
ALRDLYHEVAERGLPWTEEDGNPWEDKSPEAKRTAIDQGTSTTPASHTSRGISDGSPQEREAELLNESTTLEQPSQGTGVVEPVASDGGASQEKGTSMTPPAPVALEPVVPAEPIVPETHRPTPTAKRHSIGHSYSAMPVVRMPVPTLEATWPSSHADSRAESGQPEPLWAKESPPIVGSQTLWATYRASESDEAQLALAQQNLHHAVRGMPEIADRLTQRWARKTERGLQNALREYKDVTQLPESRALPQEFRQHTPPPPMRMEERAFTPPPTRMEKSASRASSRPSSATKERRELSIHQKRNHEEHRPGVPGGRTAERSAERQRLAKAREGRGALAKEELARKDTPRGKRPEREEVARLSPKGDREERGPHHRAAKDQVRKSSPEKKMGAVPADLFEIPEQLREAKRRTAELESQLAELRKRLQLQENRSLTARTLVASAGSLAINPPAIALRPGDVYYPQPPEHGSRTPTRYSLGAPAGPQQVDTPAPQAAPAPRAVHAVHAVHAAALTARSLSPTPAPGTVNGAWTWPGHLGRGGAIYAAPAGVASPTRVASPGAYVASPPRVASPVRFIQGQTVPTFWFPRTVSVSPQPLRPPQWLVMGEPNLAKEAQNPQPCTEGWAPLSEPTSTL